MQQTEADTPRARRVDAPENRGTTHLPPRQYTHSTNPDSRAAARTCGSRAAASGYSRATSSRSMAVRRRCSQAARRSRFRAQGVVYELRLQ